MQVDKNNVTKLDADNSSGKYKVKTIQDSTVYIKESESGHLLEFYYQVSLKEYPKKENTQKLISAIQHFRKLINLFYKNYPDKPTTISETINIAPLIAKPTVKPTKPLK